MIVRITPRRASPLRWLPAPAALLVLTAVLPAGTPAASAMPSAWAEIWAEFPARPGPAEVLGIGLVVLGPDWSLLAAGTSGASDPDPVGSVPAGAPPAATAGGNQGWHALEMEWNVSGNPDPPPEGSEYQ